MTASKHPHAGTADSVPPLPNDLRRDPGVSPVWSSGTLPFRLIAAPSAAHVLDHLRLTAAARPWHVSARPEQP